MKKEKGFTLIELVVVIIIVGILASVAIPMMQSMKQKAILTEAVMQLGAIRGAMRLYYSEHAKYWAISTMRLDTSAIRSRLTSLAPGDVEGTFFSESCFLIAIQGDTEYFIQCDPWMPINRASRASEVMAIADKDVSIYEAYVRMYQDGTITQYGFSKTGYPLDHEAP